MKKQRQIFSAMRWEKVKSCCLFHRLSTWPQHHKVKLASLLNSKENKNDWELRYPFGRLVVKIFKKWVSNYQSSLSHFATLIPKGLLAIKAKANGTRVFIISWFCYLVCEMWWIMVDCRDCHYHRKIKRKKMPIQNMILMSLMWNNTDWIILQAWQTSGACSKESNKSKYSRIRHDDIHTNQ